MARGVMNLINKDQRFLRRNSLPELSISFKAFPTPHFHPTKRAIKKEPIIKLIFPHIRSIRERKSILKIGRAPKNFICPRERADGIPKRKDREPIKIADFHLFHFFSSIR